MEIFELRYFLEVAKHENIHRASTSIRVSPASLSKAISRLEDELQVKLFEREGRNIRLSAHGKVLQKRGSEITLLEESTRLEVMGKVGTLQSVITGPEILLSKWGLELGEKIKKLHPLARIEFRSLDDEAALEAVVRGEAHFALTTMDPSVNELDSKTLDESIFQTCVGEKHPLFAAAKAGKIVPVEKVLAHAFASPSHPLLGKVGIKQSIDGWRDDEFPRKIDFYTSSLKLLEGMVTNGQAIAYLPDYFVKRIGAGVLKISGCPYTCKQKIKLVKRKNKAPSWVNRLF